MPSAFHGPPQVTTASVYHVADSALMHPEDWRLAAHIADTLHALHHLTSLLSQVIAAAKSKQFSLMITLY